jgi:hypothetical protein
MHFLVKPFPLLALGLAAACSAAAAELPRRKAGLWRVETVMQGAPMPMGPVELCVDQKSDDIMRQRMDERKQECDKMDWRRDGDTFHISSVCKMAKTVATTEGTFTGSFDSAYHADLHVTFAPPLHGRASSDMTISAKWLGPCKPGQKAGDVVMPGLGTLGGAGGRQMNMQELMKLRDQMKRMAPPEAE